MEIDKWGVNTPEEELTVLRPLSDITNYTSFNSPCQTSLPKTSVNSLDTSVSISLLNTSENSKCGVSQVVSETDKVRSTFLNLYLYYSEYSLLLLSCVCSFIG